MVFAALTDLKDGCAVMCSHLNLSPQGDTLTPNS